MWKILINSKAVPVLIEVPEKPCQDGCTDKSYCFDTCAKETGYTEALSTALADESKWIPFKDDDIDKIIHIISGTIVPNLDARLNWLQLHISQTFDLPPNVSVIFEEEQYIGSETENSFTIGYRKLAVLTPKENSAHSFTEGMDLPGVGAI